MIKVILREDVTGLGRAGDVKQVKEGYARNYLLPRSLAMAASEDNLKKIEQERKRRETQRTLEIKKATELAQKLANFSLTLTVEVNEEEKLYGSLAAQDIAKAISAEGIEVDKKNIALAVPIKDLGIYDVEVRLHHDVTTKIKVWVVKK